MGGSSINYVMAVSRPPSASKWFLAGGVNAANCIVAYAPKGAASLAASYTNLANPGTYTAAPGVAPTFDTATGWSFAAASTQYLTTGVVVNGGNYTVILRFSGATDWVGTQSRPIGTANASNTNPRLFIVGHNVQNLMYYTNGAGTANKAPQISGGVVAVAGNKAYRNGTDEGITLPAWSGTNNNGLFIGAQNGGGTPEFYYTGSVQAAAIYDSTLTAPQVAAISAAMAAL